MLGDFGAEVVKVEKPGKPDALREWPPHKDGSPLWWKTMARNKHAVTLDISRPEAREITLRLFGMSDFRREFPSRHVGAMGVVTRQVKGELPRVCWVRVSGWGQTGPYRQQGGYATIAEAFSGLASITGFPDKGPMVSAFPMGDYLAGIFGAFGALAAIRRGNLSGKGQVVDVALYEPMLRILESVVVRFDQLGQKKLLRGNQMEEDVPRNVYRTADGGSIAISCGSQRVFDGLADAMDRPDLKFDPQFATMVDRVKHREVINSLVARWIAAKRTEDALEVLITHGVVAGRINDIEDVLSDRHVAARAAIQTLLDVDVGQMRMPAPVPKLSNTPGSIRWLGQNPGSANDKIFREWLGLNSAEIDVLRRAGVV